MCGVFWGCRYWSGYSNLRRWISSIVFNDFSRKEICKNTSLFIRLVSLGENAERCVGTDFPFHFASYLYDGVRRPSLSWMLFFLFFCRGIVLRRLCMIAKWMISWLRSIQMDLGRCCLGLLVFAVVSFASVSASASSFSSIVDYVSMWRGFVYPCALALWFVSKGLFCFRGLTLERRGHINERIFCLRLRAIDRRAGTFLLLHLRSFDGHHWLFLSLLRSFLYISVHSSFLQYSMFLFSRVLFSSPRSFWRRFFTPRR